MFNKLKFLYKEYPSQYWLMIAGVVISTAGGSMIWPFLLNRLFTPRPMSLTTA